MLARGTGIAIWRQLAEILEAAIAEGEWRPGERLPTEADLATRFAVNRHTVRQALAGGASSGRCSRKIPPPMRTAPMPGTFFRASCRVVTPC